MARCKYFVTYKLMYDHSTLPDIVDFCVSAESYQEAEEKAAKKMRQKVGEAGYTFYGGAQIT